MDFTLSSLFLPLPSPPRNRKDQLNYLLAPLLDLETGFLVDFLALAGDFLAFLGAAFFFAGDFEAFFVVFFAGDFVAFLVVFFTGDFVAFLVVFFAGDFVAFLVAFFAGDFVAFLVGAFFLVVVFLAFAGDLVTFCARRS